MPITSPAVGDQATAAWAVSVAAQLNAGGWIGGNTSASTVTLSTTSAFAGLGSKTFTLTEQRRVRIYVNVEYDPATAVIATYQTIAGYNSGSSAVIGSFTQAGMPFSINYATVRPFNGAVEGTVLLAAGTYTAYASVKRVSGGTATDTAGPFQVDVYDVGSV